MPLYVYEYVRGCARECVCNEDVCMCVIVQEYVLVRARACEGLCVHATICACAFLCMSLFECV